MNDHDSEIMSGILEARGFQRTTEESEADLILVNTCVVRGGAEERAIGRLAQFAALKSRRPGLIIAVTGCMAQKDGQQLLEKVPHADLVVGTRDLFKIGDLVSEIERTGEQLVSIEDLDKPVFLDAHPVRRKSGIKALVAVMYGCNNFCSYCIVPSTRGREVSRPLDEILTEVRGLADQGYLEVTLVGQNVNSYTSDNWDFADLLQAVSAIDGVQRIRFITSHPKDCSDKLLDAAARLPKVCTNFHLPAQAGADTVLARMNRKYTRGHYLALLERLRERIPNAAISTDIIVGFPDETNEEFESTYELVKMARWDSAFIFMYSPRPGTKAAEWPDTVPTEVKKQRLQKCLALQEEISGEINRKLIGSCEQILVENISKRSPTEVVGRTRGDKSIIVPGTAELIGKLINVRVTEAFPHTLFGQPIT